MAVDEPYTWELQCIFRSDGFEQVGGTIKLQFDRLSGEIGLIFGHDEEQYYLAEDQAGDGVFFKAIQVICLCYRSEEDYAKVCIVVHGLQYTLEFDIMATALHLVSALRELAPGIRVVDAPDLDEFTQNDWMIPDHHLQNPVPVMKRTLGAWRMNMRHTEMWYSKLHADFNIHAGAQVIRVHKNVLAREKGFFHDFVAPNANHQNVLVLQDNADTINALLSGLYGVSTTFTASIFSTFARGSREMKVEKMKGLLNLFLAAERYSMETVKIKIAKTFVDRIHFVEPDDLVDLARTILRDFPEDDHGLRKSIARYLATILPTIFDYPQALENLCAGALVSTAVFEFYAEMQLTGDVLILPLNLPGRPPMAPIAPLRIGGFDALDLPNRREAAERRERD